MRILYVEDDPFDADLTRRALRKNAPNIDLEIARSAHEARAILDRDHAFNLMMTDLRLPDGSGMALLTLVRERRLPMAVVVITGQGDEEVAVSALKAGANDYLVKRQNYLDHLALTLEAAHHRYLAETRLGERPLSVLYLENDPLNVEDVRRHFSNHAHHIHLHSVYTAAEILALLPLGSEPNYDALILDYHQQDMNALDLLKELRQVRRLEIPIILVTAQGDEELAVQALRLGAYDYVVKGPGYLYRLPGLLENAYHRYQLTCEQAALRQSEERFRRLAENAPDIIYRLRTLPDFYLEYISPAVETITGYSPVELYGAARNWLQVIYPKDRRVFREKIISTQSNPRPTEIRFVRKDGLIIWVEARNIEVRDEAGNTEVQEGIIRDITERKQSEERNRLQLQRLHALRAIDAAITANLDLTQTLNVLLEHVCAQLGMDAAAILLYNAEDEILTYRLDMGFKSPAEALQVRLDESPAAAAIRTLHPAVSLRSTLPASAYQTAQIWRSEGFEICFSAPLVVKEKVLGVLDVYARSKVEVDGEWLNFLETLAGQAAIAIDNAGLLDGLQHANMELIEAYDVTLEGWVSALDLRDKETEVHTRRVTEMTMRLAHSFGIDAALLPHIRRGALLHDIGKMGIPDGILLKPGPLNDSEMTLMRKHPEFAFQLLSPIAYLNRALDIPLYHHERWDGGGYPKGLKGEEIPLAARIFAVVDVWDALSSDRPYRLAWVKDKVLNYIRSERGRHFDPKVVDVFLQLVCEQ